MNSIEKTWREFLGLIINIGDKHVKDDGDVLYESLVNHTFIHNVLNEFGGQNITLKMFIDMIKKGVFNIKGYPISDEALAEYVLALDNEEQITNKNSDGSDKFVYTYPERLFNIQVSNKDGEVEHVNQINVIIDRLKKHDGSNRAVATLYNVGLDRYEQHIPCLNWLQVTIRNNQLVLHVLFRSNDCFGAYPSNMLFLQYLGLKITEELKETYPLLVFKGVNYNSISLHIYESDYESACEVVK